MAAEDIVAEAALEISQATGGGGLPYIRHGKYYELLVTRIHMKRVKMEDTKWHTWAFMEFKVLKAVPFEKGKLPVRGRGTGVSKYNPDDGANPNEVGSRCSNSLDKDGKGAAMFATNIKEFQAGFFGLAVDQISQDDSMKSWVDMCRREDVRAGGVDYVDPRTKQAVVASKDKVANMACGYVIACSTGAKELKETKGSKDIPDDERKYFTEKFWQCVAKPGTGVNSKEEVAKRRAQILMEIPLDDEDDDVGDDYEAAAPSAASQGQNGAQAAGGAPTPPEETSLTPTPPEDAAPTPPEENWPPRSPWETVNDSNKNWLKPGWVFSNPKNGGDKRVIKEVDYRAGKR